MPLFTSTFLGLVHEKSAEAAAADEPPVSMEQAVGRINIDLHRLVAELTLPAHQQNSESLLEALVSIALTCTSCAEGVVLPNLREETE